MCIRDSFYDNGESNEGRAFVYHGSAVGLNSTPNWTAESNQASAGFGRSVGTAGDVNGDGYADVIVGAFWYDNGEGYEGRAFVYHGSAAGLSTTANWTAESNQASAYFGHSVGTAGDVNGDGYADVIVGASGYDNGENNEGRAFVYHGSAAGLSTTANWTAESNQYAAHFGNSVGTAGDVNGDSYADVIVGAYEYTNGESDEGRAFVYHGSAVGLSTTPNWTAESNQRYAEFGYSVGTAGDVNGDGYADVIVGAYDYDHHLDNEGRAFVYHGSAMGLSITADWTAEGAQEDAGFGCSVGTAGDVNGDGYADVIVGAYQYDNGEYNEGRAFVYYGGVASALSIIKSVAGAGGSTQDLPLGGVVTYTIALTNNEDDIASGVVMTDTMPNGASFGGWLEQGLALLPPPGDTITWGPHDVPANDGYTIRFTATITTDSAFAGQTIPNIARFSSADAGSGSDGATFTVAPLPVPALNIIKSVAGAGGGTQDLPLGGVVTYTIVLTNSGEAIATSVVMTDTLPDGVSFGSWLEQGLALLPPPGDTITWGPHDVPANNEYTIRFTATITTDSAFAAHTISNIARFSSANAGSGSDEATFIVAPISIYLPLVLKK